jgi:hypothetical protein
MKNKVSKIIFISSLIISEELNNIKKNLIELDKLFSCLDYTKYMFINQKDIIQRCSNYIILRTGNTYGYIEDDKRMFNVPNFFLPLIPKMAI